MTQSEREFYEKYTTGCMHGSGASCVCACPFNLEVDLFVDKMRIRSYSGAYRIYQESVVFPEIVSRVCPAPCQQHCVFGEEMAIRLPLLERTCQSNVKDRDRKPAFYNMPAKTSRIAIVGAGLSGLSCALKLCMKNYQVTVFEKSDRIGGNLWELLDSEIFMTDIDTQFEDFSYDLQLNTEITALEALSEFDAVYIATGSGGNDFGLTDGMNTKSFGAATPGFFLGGRLIGGSDMDAIQHGKIASFSIELFTKIKKMDGVSTTFQLEECKFAPPKAVQKGCEPAVIPSEGEIYSKEEASDEARRCIKCDCSACFDRCELMQSIKQYPPKMTKDALVSMSAIPELDGLRISTRTISSCLQCGACEEFCPISIDMAKFFNDFRYLMNEDGSMPLPFHDFFVQDFKFSESDDVRVVRAAPDGKNSNYAFFPGCQLGGSNPEAVKKTYSFLLDKLPGTSLMMMCCGVPAHWAGQTDMFKEHLDRIRGEWEQLGQPTMIVACVTCQKTFETFLPEISVVSLYELLSEYDFSASVSGEPAVVFDPCSSRTRGDIQKSVRNLAQSSGYALEELENHGKEAECCGYGGHTHFAKPGYTDAITEKRVNASELPYLVYCANCRESFAEQGKECRHILDVIFGIESRREAATKSDRRQTRRQLKADMLKEFWSEDDITVFSPYSALIISDALRERMHKHFIVADDLLKSIQTAEESGRVLYDPSTKNRVAHLRVGERTYWTVYSKDDNDVYELKSTYSHRLNIEE